MSSNQLMNLQDSTQDATRMSMALLAERIKRIFIVFGQNASQTRGRIAELRTVAELIDFISIEFIQACSTIVLLYWIASPIWIMIGNIPFKHVDQWDEFLNQSLTASNWQEILQRAGMIGWMIGIALLGKRIRVSQSHAKSLTGIHMRNGEFSLRTSISTDRTIHEAISLSFLFMLLWSALSYLFSDNRSVSWYGDQYRLEGLRTYFMYGGIFTLGLAIRTWNGLKQLLRGLTFASTILALFVLLSYQPFNIRLGIDAQAGVFFNSNHYGYFLTISTIAALYLHLTMIHGHRLYLIAFLVQTAALIQNQSLGPFLGVCCGLIAIIMGMRWLDQSKLKPMMTATGLFCLTSLVMNLFSKYLSTDLIRLFRDVGLVFQRSRQSGSAGSGRWILWTNGIRFIGERPLFGYGPDNLGTRYLAENIKIDRPHNELIQFAASLGIPALIFYLSALVLLAVSFYRSRQRLGVQGIVLAGMIIAYFVSSLFGNTMFYTTPYFIIIISVATSLITQFNT